MVSRGGPVDGGWASRVLTTHTVRVRICHMGPVLVSPKSILDSGDGDHHPMGGYRSDTRIVGVGHTGIGPSPRRCPSNPETKLKRSNSGTKSHLPKVRRMVEQCCSSLASRASSRNTNTCIIPFSTQKPILSIEHNAMNAQLAPNLDRVCNYLQIQGSNLTCPEHQTEPRHNHSTDDGHAPHYIITAIFPGRDR